ncbi:MAG: hypothetical protein ACOCXA_02995, partial [Planctomycetota bacterium]
MHRTDRTDHARQGMLLVVCVILISFIVIICSSFVAIMAEYRGLGRSRRAKVHTEAAVTAARVHAFRVLQDHVMEPVGADSVDPLFAQHAPDWHTSLASSFVRVFEADKDMEPGDVWPDSQIPLRTVAERNRNIGQGTWNDAGSATGSTTLNSGFWDSLGWFMGTESRQVYTDFTNGAVQGARYFEMDYLDDAYQPVPPAERARARYVVRYAVQILDQNALINLNFYPEEDLFEQLEAGGATDERERLAALRQRYGMHLMNMMGTDSHLGQFWSAQHNAPLFSAWAAGGTGLRAVVRRPEEVALHRFCLPWSDREEGWTTNQNPVLYDGFYGARMANIFEGRGIQQYDGAYRQTIPGPVYSWGQISHQARYPVNYKQSSYGQAFTPFGTTLRRSAGDQTDSPWVYNILTAAQYPMRLALHGWAARGRRGHGEMHGPRSGNNAYGPRSWVTADLLPWVEGKPLRPAVRGGAHDDDWVPFSDTTAPVRGVLATDSRIAASPTTADAWYERLAIQRQWFYGLRGNEGLDIGPRFAIDQGEKDFWMVADGVLQFSGYRRMRDHAAGGFANSVRPTPAIYHQSYEFDVIEALSLAVQMARFAWGHQRAFIANADHRGKGKRS